MAESKSPLRQSPARECLAKVARWLKEDKSHEQWKSFVSNSMKELQGKEKNVFRAAIEQIEGEEPQWDKVRLQDRVKEKIDVFDVYQSVWNGEERFVREYLSAHPEEKDRPSPYGTTFLYSACRNNHFSLIKYFVEEAKCGVNIGNSRVPYGSDLDPSIGSTPLHAACYQGFLPLCVYLVHHGGDYYLRNRMNETPIDNGRSERHICQFFSDLLLSRYSPSSIDDAGEEREGDLPGESLWTLVKKKKKKKKVKDCWWEYLSLDGNQWLGFDDRESEFIHRSSLEDQSEVKSNLFRFSLKHFSRRGKDRFDKDKFNWIRCRGSSLLNFHWGGQWQLMINTPPSPSPSLVVEREILPFPVDVTSFESLIWYECPPELNLKIERGMNYRRRSISLLVPSLSVQRLFFDLEHFQFFTADRTLSGHLRWIRHCRSLQDLDSLLQSPVNEEQNDDEHLPLFPTSQKHSSGLKNVEIRCGDLLADKSEVLVICRSSKYLLETLMSRCGQSFVKLSKEKMKESLIELSVEKFLPSSRVYLMDWNPSRDLSSLRHSLDELLRRTIDLALKDGWKSIAYPAIGCGEHQCSPSFVAQTFFHQLKKLLSTRSLRVSVIIHPQRPEISEQFHRELQLIRKEEKKKGPVVVELSNGSTIEVIRGDLRDEKVDVIVGSSSSENLRQSLLNAAGEKSEKIFKEKFRENPNALLIYLPGGALQCEQLFFFKWTPEKDDERLFEQSLIDLIVNLVQNVLSFGYHSISLPAIGCGEYQVNSSLLIRILLRTMKEEIQRRNLAQWKVRFVLQSHQEELFEQFQEEIKSNNDSSPPSSSSSSSFPSHWTSNSDGQDHLSMKLLPQSEEYQRIVSQFDQSMKGNYQKIVFIERIQNERWFAQYLAHAKDFEKRLKKDTEKHLFHGCPEQAATAIINDCFNRSYAGVNGTAYGVGVYFSSNALYSHSYSPPNKKGERVMFLARVLIGQTTLGNSTMKTRPPGFDSTTNGSNIFVTYHDAQAYAEYLIRYR